MQLESGARFCDDLATAKLVEMRDAHNTRG